MKRALLAATLLACTLAEAAPPQDSLAQRVLACTACHGREGRAAPDGYHPRIAGKPALYLFNQLVNFREGRRRYAPMVYLVDHLGDDYLREIAEHFAAIEAPYPAPAAANSATSSGSSPPAITPRMKSPNPLSSGRSRGPPGWLRAASWIRVRTQPGHSTETPTFVAPARARSPNRVSDRVTTACFDML